MRAFDSKWLNFQPETSRDSTDKTDKRASVSFVSESEGHSGRENVYDWRKLYPDIDPSEWRIFEDHRGVFGFKIRGSFVGLTTFFVPRGWRPTTKGKEMT